MAQQFHQKVPSSSKQYIRYTHLWGFSHSISKSHWKDIHFEIKNFIVLGNIKADMKEKLKDWDADQRTYVGGFFKKV